MDDNLVRVTENFFSVIDYVVFGLVLTVSMLIGVYFGFCGEQSTEQFLLGGRQMKVLPIAISLIASQLSGVSIIGVPAESYSFGIQMITGLFTFVPIVIVLNYVVIPVFYNNNLSNCYEYLEMRFNKPVRSFVTFSFILCGFLMMPVIIFVPAMAFAQVSNLNVHMINTAVCIICVVYTMLGGIKAVVWTDVVQAGIMFGSCILVAVMGTQQAGGFTEVLKIAEAGGRLDFLNLKFDLVTRQTFWNTTIGFFCMWIAYIGLSQSCVQRIVALPSLAHARMSLSIFAVGAIFISLVNIFTGVIMYAYYYDCDPVQAKLVDRADKLMPFFVQDILGHLKGLPGIFISCVFSAALSTMSANLHSLAGVVYSDYIRPLNMFKHTDRAANTTMKMVIILMGIYSILMGFIVEQFSSIIQLMMTMVGVSMGAVAGVFTLGMLYPWSNRHGALYGTVASICTLLFIVIKSQIAIRTGDLWYTPLPTLVDNCEHRFNVTIDAIPTEPTIMDDTFAIHKIAFIWYSAIGAAIVWIIGVPLSHLTGAQQLENLDMDLLSPVIHPFMPRSMKHANMQMKTVSKLEGDNTKEQTEWVFANNESKA